MTRPQMAKIRSDVDVDETTLQWLVLCVESQRERFVIRWLGGEYRGPDGSVYPPRFSSAWTPGYTIPAAPRVAKGHRYQRPDRWAPLLSGYVFVRANYYRHRNELLGTPHVLGFCPTGLDIDDEGMRALREIERRGGIPAQVSCGREVRFRMAGADWCGTVQAMRGTHIDVAIEILQRPVKVTIERSALRR